MKNINMKSKINARIIADSLSPQGHRITSYILTYPRIIHAELMTHRMFSRNSASSRAIPFKKMAEMVEENPFIPITWQIDHKGMQGSDYKTGDSEIQLCINKWIEARDNAVQSATLLNKNEIVTKQLCNRLLEPFMWHTVLVTATEFSNFFKLRCPQYNYLFDFYKSKKDVLKASKDGKYNDGRNFSDFTTEDWLGINSSQAEIHIQALAEAMYDEYNESTPKLLKEGEWHIPFKENINNDGGKFVKFMMDYAKNRQLHTYPDGTREVDMIKVKVSTAMAARTSYTVVGGEKEIDYAKMIELHDRLLADGHASPMEHCAKVPSQNEYDTSPKGKEKGWFRNYKGFKSYRQISEE